MADIEPLRRPYQHLPSKAVPMKVTSKTVKSDPLSKQIQDVEKPTTLRRPRNTVSLAEEKNLERDEKSKYRLHFDNPQASLLLPTVLTKETTKNKLDPKEKVERNQHENPYDDASRSALSKTSSFRRVGNTSHEPLKVSVSGFGVATKINGSRSDSVLPTEIPLRFGGLIRKPKPPKLLEPDKALLIVEDEVIGKTSTVSTTTVDDNYSVEVTLPGLKFGGIIRKTKHAVEDGLKPVLGSAVTKILGLGFLNQDKTLTTSAMSTKTTTQRPLTTIEENFHESTVTKVQLTSEDTAPTNIPTTTAQDSSLITEMFDDTVTFRTTQKAVDTLPAQVRQQYLDHAEFEKIDVNGKKLTRVILPPFRANDKMVLILNTQVPVNTSFNASEENSGKKVRYELISNKTGNEEIRFFLPVNGKETMVVVKNLDEALESPGEAFVNAIGIPASIVVAIAAGAITASLVFVFLVRAKMIFPILYLMFLNFGTCDDKKYDLGSGVVSEVLRDSGLIYKQNFPRWGLNDPKPTVAVENTFTTQFLRGGGLIRKPKLPKSAFTSIVNEFSPLPSVVPYEVPLQTAVPQLRPGGLIRKTKRPMVPLSTESVLENTAKFENIQLGGKDLIKVTLPTALNGMGKKTVFVFDIQVPSGYVLPKSIAGEDATEGVRYEVISAKESAAQEIKFVVPSTDKMEGTVITVRKNVTASSLQGLRPGGLVRKTKTPKPTSAYITEKPSDIVQFEDDYVKGIKLTKVTLPLSLNQIEGETSTLTLDLQVPVGKSYPAQSEIDASENGVKYELISNEKDKEIIKVTVPKRDKTEEMKLILKRNGNTGVVSSIQLSKETIEKYPFEDIFTYETTIKNEYISTTPTLIEDRSTNILEDSTTTASTLFTEHENGLNTNWTINQENIMDSGDKLSRSFIVVNINISEIKFETFFADGKQYAKITLPSFLEGIEEDKTLTFDYQVPIGKTFFAQMEDAFEEDFAVPYEMVSNYPGKEVVKFKMPKYGKNGETVLILRRTGKSKAKLSIQVLDKELLISTSMKIRFETTLVNGEKLSKVMFPFSLNRKSKTKSSLILNMQKPVGRTYLAISDDATEQEIEYEMVSNPKDHEVIKFTIPKVGENYKTLIMLKRQGTSEVELNVELKKNEENVTATPKPQTKPVTIVTDTVYATTDSLSPRKGVTFEEVFLNGTQLWKVTLPSSVYGNGKNTELIFDLKIPVGQASVSENGENVGEGAVQYEVISDERGKEVVKFVVLKPQENQPKIITLRRDDLKIDSVFVDGRKLWTVSFPFSIGGQQNKNTTLLVDFQVPVGQSFLAVPVNAGSEDIAKEAVNYEMISKEIDKEEIQFTLQSKDGSKKSVLVLKRKGSPGIELTVENLAEGGGLVSKPVSERPNFPTVALVSGTTTSSLITPSVLSYTTELTYGGDIHNLTESATLPTTVTKPLQTSPATKRTETTRSSLSENNDEKPSTISNTEAPFDNNRFVTTETLPPNFIDYDYDNYDYEDWSTKSDLSESTTVQLRPTITESSTISSSTTSSTPHPSLPNSVDVKFEMISKKLAKVTLPFSLNGIGVQTELILNLDAPVGVLQKALPVDSNNDEIDDVQYEIVSNEKGKEVVRMFLPKKTEQAYAMVFVRRQVESSFDTFKINAKAFVEVIGIPGTVVLGAAASINAAVVVVSSVVLLHRVTGRMTMVSKACELISKLFNQ
ncbi:hypothetical protein FQR65_LT15467 [Abscondita terminalis]|nr:hypothetical protein FQR65_LT15467 [Abscondita terminalis]